MKLFRLLCTLAAITLLTACGTTTGKILGTTAQTVDTSMRAWANYVVYAKPGVEAETKVRKAYEAYQSAMGAALAAYATADQTGQKSGFEIASKALAAARGNLLRLIDQLTANANRAALTNGPPLPP